MISMGSLNCKSELQFISSVKEESENGRCVSMNSALVDLLGLDMNFSTHPLRRVVTVIRSGLQAFVLY